MAKKPAAKKPAAAPAKKKAASAKKSYIAKAPIRRLMKSEGADLVSESALVFLIGEIEKAAKEVTKAAMGLVKDEGRKRVTEDDIRIASPDLL